MFAVAAFSSPCTGAFGARAGKAAVGGWVMVPEETNLLESTVLVLSTRVVRQYGRAAGQLLCHGLLLLRRHCALRAAAPEL